MQLLSKPPGICCLPSRAGVSASWPLRRPEQWGVCTQPGRRASGGICPASLGCQGAEGSRLSPAGIYILIAVGAVMMFVGFLGCYGAIQESQCLLGTVRPWAGARLRVRAAGPAGGRTGGRTGSSGGDRTPSVPDVEPGARPGQSDPADLPQNASSPVSPFGSQIPPRWTAVTSSSLSSSY